DEHTRLAAEKEILGFFITGHPLERYKNKLEDFRALSTQDICAFTKSTGKDEYITTAGMITNIRVQKSRKGDFWAQGSLEDMLGTIDLLVFPDAYRKLQEKLKLEIPVLVRAGVRVEEGSNPKLTLSDVIPLEDAQPKLPRSLRIRIPTDSATDLTIDAL